MDRSDLNPAFQATPGAPLVDWSVSERVVEYDAAIEAMDRKVSDILKGHARECVWLLEHPSVYTAGTSASDGDLPQGLFPVHRTGRGGQYTYHGPGQRVAYVMLDLKQRNPDVRAFVSALEQWIIDALAALAVLGERREDRVGVWVRRTANDRQVSGEDKIAALGIRIRRWVSFHGIAINVRPDLSHFSGIIPCGIRDARYGVTSLAALGLKTRMADLDAVLRTTFEVRFGPTLDAATPA